MKRATDPDLALRRLASAGWLLTIGVTVAALATRVISGAPPLPNRFSMGDGVVVVGLQTLLTPFTRGDSVPVAASTLVVFALFKPLRRRVQSTIDRRFYRSRYDAERIQVTFANRLRRNVDLESIAAEVRGVVGATIAPASVGLWLRRRGREAHS